eukprot:2621700-Rhodomonas_salina.1
MCIRDRFKATKHGIVHHSNTRPMSTLFESLMKRKGGRKMIVVILLKLDNCDGFSRPTRSEAAMYPTALMNKTLRIGPPAAASAVKRMGIPGSTRFKRNSRSEATQEATQSELNQTRRTQTPLCVGSSMTLCTLVCYWYPGRFLPQYPGTRVPDCNPPGRMFDLVQI